MASLAESLVRERAGIFKPDRAWYRPVPTTVPFGQLVRSEASPWATAFQVEHVTAAASRKTGKRRLGLVNFVQRTLPGDGLLVVWETPKQEGDRGLSPWSVVFPTVQFHSSHPAPAPPEGAAWRCDRCPEACAAKSFAREVLL